jgi:hypothetical protein
MEGRTMYIDKSYIAPGASPRLAAVVLAVTGADVGESAVPAHSKEGVHLSHLLCYRVAVELDIPPAEIGKVFGASIADWIENPARERASLRDVDYGSIYDEKPEEYLSKWDLSKSRARYETFEKETEEWAKAHEKELEAWRAKMRAWLASPEAKDR